MERFVSGIWTLFGRGLAWEHGCEVKSEGAKEWPIEERGGREKERREKREEEKEEGERKRRESGRGREEKRK